MSGHAYATSVPRRLLRALGIHSDVTDYELQWVLFDDGGLIVKLKRKVSELS